MYQKIIFQFFWAFHLLIKLIKLKILPKRGVQNMDMRVVIVLAPLAIAAGWALFNIGAAALRQLQTFLNEEA